MFENTRLPVILMPTLLVLCLAFLIQSFRAKRSADAVQNALARFKWMTIGTGIFLVVLVFCLPMTPSLSSFGYPQTVEDIQSPKHLLEYLQSYNKALVRTTEVLYWFLFVFVWWFLASIHSLTQVFKHETNIRVSSPDLTPKA